jgi:hypothetical protein
MLLNSPIQNRSDRESTSINGLHRLLAGVCADETLFKLSRSVSDAKNTTHQGQQLTIGSKQHRACWPMAAQMLVKSSVLVGGVGAVW